MRLIDATIQPMFLAEYILERKDTFIRILEKSDNDFLFGLLMDYFDEQPTAYDVDKVVEQLKERSEEYNSGVRLHGKPEEMLMDEAIEIVKGGGIDGN
jgi:succinate dehydrogenase flavin-adding protein (antitoxin of CptAB toxin-antitoxin module)